MLFAVVEVAAAEAPPAGALFDTGGPGACVAEMGAVVGLEQHGPAADGCAEGRTIQELHHVVVCTAAGSPTHDPGDESAIAVFSRDARTGAVSQLPGKIGCTERTEIPRDL